MKTKKFIVTLFFLIFYTRPTQRTICHRKKKKRIESYTFQNVSFIHDIQSMTYKNNDYKSISIRIACAVIFYNKEWRTNTMAI